MNKYTQLKEKQTQEMNSFPMAFAFSNEQFKEGMETLGLTENDTAKVASIGLGGFIRKSDVNAFSAMNRKQRKEKEEAINQDTTGEGYIKDMFRYELSNHEYGYTYELNDTLDALGLTIEEINQSAALLNGLQLAKTEYLQSVD